MRKMIFVLCIALSFFTSANAKIVKFRELGVSQYIDKMKAGWIGQMAGVGWGGPTEFKWKSAIIPEGKMPAWKPELVNQFHQDDIYVEMTFLRTMELYGLNASIRQAGIDFANSGYSLWHANRAGRTNLRRGIAPPDSGHPQFNSHADDIDYQIEADFSGLIAPGMPNLVIELGEKFGRLMNYGDGLYGGQFVGAMYAEAFFENDIEKIIRTGLKAIPPESQYYQCITDVLNWYEQNPDNWQKTWQLINAKYHENPDYRRFSCSGPRDPFNIDAKINGAYIVMGLLYGRGDPDKTIIISTRCGQDSDCNPSNAAGVLFTTIGFSNLPDKFKSALNPAGKFSHTPYNFPMLIKVCEKLTSQAVTRGGGLLKKELDGKEVFAIPLIEPKPGKLEQCSQPGPIASSRFTEAEMGKILFKTVDMQKIIDKFAPGFEISGHLIDTEDDTLLGLHNGIRGKDNIMITHPRERNRPCILSKDITVPQAKKTALHLIVGHHEEGDWMLNVTVDGRTVYKKVVGRQTTTAGWLDIEIDLTNHAGKMILLQLHNQPTSWHYEQAYWSKIELVTGIKN